MSFTPASQNVGTSGGPGYVLLMKQPRDLELAGLHVLLDHRHAQHGRVDLAGDDFPGSAALRLVGHVHHFQAPCLANIAKGRWTMPPAPEEP